MNLTIHVEVAVGVDGQGRVHCAATSFKGAQIRGLPITLCMPSPERFRGAGERE
jgi:hypothetical protein